MDAGAARRKRDWAAGGELCAKHGVRLAVRLLAVAAAAFAARRRPRLLVAPAPLPGCAPRHRALRGGGAGPRLRRALAAAAGAPASPRRSRREGGPGDAARSPDVVLNCPASHLQRLTDFVSATYPCSAAWSPAEEGGEGSRRQKARLLLLRCSDPAEVMRRIVCDGNLAWAVQKVYCTDRREPPQRSLEDVARSLVRQLQKPELRPEGGAPLAVRLSCFPSTRTSELALRMAGLLSEERAVPCALSPARCGVVAAAVLARGLWFTGVAPAGGQVPHMASRRGAGRARSRAYFKLAEALQRAGARPEPGALALDLGAAPGGWSQCLAEAGCGRVFAVDPAELAPGALGAPGVEHLRATAAEASARLAGRQREGALPPLDVLTCDMYLGPGRSVVAALEEDGALALLRPRALVVVTLKGTEAPGHSKRRFAEQLEPVVERFRAICEDVELFHLMANRDRERTLVGFKRR